MEEKCYNLKASTSTGNDHVKILHHGYHKNWKIWKIEKTFSIEESQEILNRLENEGILPHNTGKMGKF